VNDGLVYRERIGASAAGQQLASYLSANYSHSTLAEWRVHVAAGRVLLDGSPARPDAVLRLRETLEWHRPPWTEPEAPLSCPVLYDEGGVLVVHKPPGLPTLPGGGFLQHTLLHQVRLAHPGASPVHRLGRWTSGAVLCSRSKAVGAHLAAQFAERRVGKRYRALASGDPAWDSRQVDVPIGPVPYGPLGTLHAASPEGRPAASLVTVIERRGSDFLCDVRIATGRPHQIRIHLAALRHPLVGDPLYVEGGLPEPKGDALPGDPGYSLHAAEIAFEHPETAQRVTVSAPLPPELCCDGE